MNSRITISFILLGAVFCLLGVEGQIFESKPIRNSRPRYYIKSHSKRPPSTPASEDYVHTNTRRPAHLEGGNQWKPLYNLPLQTSTKYRLKPNTYSSKYQQNNVIYPSEYYSKSSYTHPQSSINFVANQTLRVSDSTIPSNPKPSPTYKKNKYHYVSKKNYNQQYEVHENSQEDTPSYSTQTQYHYQSIPIIKGKNPIPINPSVQYTEVGAGPENHFHHVHYHDTIEDALKASKAKNYARNYRGNPTSTRSY